MSSEIEILSEFKKQLLAFFDELIAQFPREGDLVIIRLFIATQIAIKDVMTNFIHKLNTKDNELRKIIKARNDTFFLEHNVFDTTNTHNQLKKLWISGQLDKEDKEVIWKWMDTFVFLADKYILIISK